MALEYRFVGFLVKKVVGRPESLGDVESIVEIASVSACFSERPLDPSECHSYNHASLYNDPETAWNGVPEEDRGAYRLYAYRVLLAVFDDSGLRDGFPFDTSIEWCVPCVSEPDLSGFELMGYDVVSTYGTFVDHSPLSCNGLAKTHPVNSYCLLDDEAQAIALADRVGRGELPAEPQPYVVMEVLRSRAGSHWPPGGHQVARCRARPVDLSCSSCDRSGRPIPSSRTHACREQARAFSHVSRPSFCEQDPSWSVCSRVTETAATWRGCQRVTACEPHSCKVWWRTSSSSTTSAPPCWSWLPSAPTGSIRAAGPSDWATWFPQRSTGSRSCWGPRRLSAMLARVLPSASTSRALTTSGHACVVWGATSPARVREREFHGNTGEGSPMDFPGHPTVAGAVLCAQGQWAGR